MDFAFTDQFEILAIPDDASFGSIHLIHLPTFGIVEFQKLARSSLYENCSTRGLDIHTQLRHPNVANYYY